MSSQGLSKAANPDFIDKSELKMLLVNMRQYLELWVMFDRVDLGDDRRITQQEFVGASVSGTFTDWGLDVQNAEESFRNIDTNGGGQILFDEFATWAISSKLDLRDAAARVAFQASAKKGAEAAAAAAAAASDAASDTGRSILIF